MTQKIKVSKSGFNAVSETAPDNLIFSSDYETLRYSTSGTVNLDWSEVAATFNTYSATPVSHNLGYIPFFVVFVDYTNSGTFKPAPYVDGSVSFLERFFSYADTTKLYFKAQTWKDSGTTSTDTAVFRYFIFKNNIGI